MFIKPIYFSLYCNCIENMTKLSAAVELLQDAANSALDIGEDERAQVQAGLAKVAQLLELLASVVEGKGL